MQSSEFEYAGFWERVGASLIDMIILLTATYPILWLFYRGDWERIFATGLSEQPQVFWFDILANYILPFAYTVIVWLLWSASPGKILLGMKIVDAETGQNIDLKQSIIRYIGYFPAMMVFMIGIFWVAFDKRKQGWHDKMANTVVIRNSD
ncbi:RDD family protein [Acinetobacter pragensis]|uniref:RDD family protein n=1 Tax=Acinetobacter pragensis TaxID=1806892 RepID=A0A151Y3C0_9GAMM|nr:RDD family protein [Acinetobacter pragensis]KYQ72508.1 RDD family protein [Acinetobacter pragensis]